MCCAEMYKGISYRSGELMGAFPLQARCSVAAVSLLLSVLVQSSSTSKAQLFLQNAPERGKSVVMFV